MNLAICTIQRDRAPWIKEWISFHYVVGFRKFYIYLHNCRDDSAEVVNNLSKYFDITAFVLGSNVDRPQLFAYNHCYNSFGGLHDWVAFIDGDEFLFSECGINISNQLAYYSDHSIGALGVYWVCFGSSSHLQEPVGLLTENYRWRADFGFDSNRHFKSIVKGRQGSDFSIINNSHWFKTKGTTQDTNRRILEHGLVTHDPCYNRLRINHYATQSREFFLNFKRNSGAADAGANVVRSERWWSDYNRNEVWDNSLDHLRSELVSTINACSVI